MIKGEPIRSILTKTAVTVSPGFASFCGCLIQSPKFRPHFGVSKSTGVTKVSRFLLEKFAGGGPGSTCLCWRKKIGKLEDKLEYILTLEY